MQAARRKGRRGCPFPRNYKLEKRLWEESQGAAGGNAESWNAGHKNHKPGNQQAQARKLRNEGKRNSTKRRPDQWAETGNKEAEQ